MRKISLFLLIIFQVFSVALFFPPASHAAATCTLRIPEDGGGDHWKPASTKSRNVWLTLEYRPKEEFGDNVSAYIARDGQELTSVLKRATSEAEKFATDKTTESGYGLVYLQNLHVYNNSYLTGASDHSWPAGNYRLVITPPNSSSSEQLCSTTFQIKQYCVADLNNDNVYKWPDTRVGFKLTEINPFQAGVKHSVTLKSDKGYNKRIERNSGVLKNDGIIWDERLDPGEYYFEIKNEEEGDIFDLKSNCHSNSFIVSQSGGREVLPGSVNENPNAPLAQPCREQDLSANGDGCKRIKTSLGYVSTDASNFTRWVLGFILSISGGIVFLIILITGYRLMTSQGDPEKVKNAKDQLTAAIIGLMFIIFSLAILELITRDILGLPGFGS